MLKNMWVYNTKPAKLTQLNKDSLLIIINNFVNFSELLSKVVNRINIHAGRCYIFHLIEPFISKDLEGQSIKPLIEGKYIELPLARITLFDCEGNHCTADWLRHTGRWFELQQGNLVECLKFIESNEQWV